MLLFITGLIVGSFITMVIFSVILAAKKGDQSVEMHQNSTNPSDTKKNS